MMREGLRIVIGPEDFLGGEACHAETFDDLRQGGAVAEGIRQPGNPAFHAQDFPEVAAPVQELAHQRFAAGQVGIRLHPHTAVGNPSAVGNGSFDFLKELRIVLTAELIFRALALEEPGFRVFFQETEHSREGAGSLPAGFLHGPEPGQVQMGIGDHAHGSGEGAVMRVDEGREQFSRFHICLPALRQGLLRVQGIQETRETDGNGLPEGILRIQIIMHIPQHREVQPELIGLLIPPAEGAASG